MQLPPALGDRAMRAARPEGGPVTGFAVVGLGGMGSRIAADSDAGHEVIVDRSHERIASGGPGASRR